MIFELPWYFDGSWEIVIWSQLCNQNFLWIWDSGRKKRWEMVGRNGNPHSSESRRQWPRRRKAPPWHRSVWVKRCEKMWKVSFKASLCFAIVSPATLSLKIDGSTVLLCYFAILSSCNRVSGCQQCIESWSNGSDWNHSFLKLVTVLNAAPNFIKGLAMPQAECRRNKKQEMFLARTCPLTVIHCKAEWRYCWMVRSFFTVRTFLWDRSWLCREFNEATEDRTVWCFHVSFHVKRHIIKHKQQKQPRQHNYQMFRFNVKWCEVLWPSLWFTLAQR